MHHIYHSSGGTLLAWKSLLFFWQPLLLLPSLSPSSSHVLTSGTHKDVGHLMARNIVSQKMRGCPKVPPASRSPSKAVFIVVILSQSVSQSVSQSFVSPVLKVELSPLNNQKNTKTPKEQTEGIPPASPEALGRAYFITQGQLVPT
jgi:hypothetical protein